LLYNAAMPDRLRTRKIEFVEHPSAARIVTAYHRYGHPKMSRDRLMRMPTEFTVNGPPTGNIEIRHVPVKDLIKAVKFIGCWGYRNRVGSLHDEIHYWIGKNATPMSVITLFAHEIAHALGYDEEEDAVMIAGIAAFAYDVCSDGGVAKAVMRSQSEGILDSSHCFLTRSDKPIRIKGAMRLGAASSDPRQGEQP